MLSGCAGDTRHESIEPGLCPANGRKGSPVALQTVKALLTETALQRLNRAAHRFCSDPDCEVVYFSDDGELYATRDIRVPVWQKEPAGARMLCYCFGENENDIRAEIRRLGYTGVAERIRGH